MAASKACDVRVGESLQLLLLLCCQRLAEHCFSVPKPEQDGPAHDVRYSVRQSLHQQPSISTGTLWEHSR